MKKLLSKSVEETELIARKFSKSVKSGDIIGLNGELGAGKTHFVRGFVQGFGMDSDVVSSPTFTIINEYQGKTPIYHFDCYRLDHYTEALEIGAEEYLYGDGVCIIEWPDKISELLPNETTRITINVTSKEEREIIFS
ncbi:MAG: tRNA (adenosine(37)-N6)-threonylcarbamoyltransferase complex ATPase subunit type 1 TsaE [Balneolaceae bacterium]